MVEKGGGTREAGRTRRYDPDMFRSTHARFDAVICDIDGCLTDEGSAPFDLEALSRVAAHNDRAIRRRDVPVITVCSGRPQPFAEAMCRLIHNSVMTCVAENGVWLYHPGTNVYDMEPSITPEHRRRVRDAEAWLLEGYGPSGVRQQPGKGASISLYHEDTAYLMDSVMPEVEAGVQEFGLRVSRTERYVNLDLAHVSKGTGLDRIIAQTGLRRERLAGIGDASSDMAIRERVEWFGCPANAIDALKVEADFVAPHERTLGVLDILDALL